MLLVRPNRDLAPTRLAKMKTTPARKFKNVACDFAAKIDNFASDLFQLGMIENNERRARVHAGGFVRTKEAAGHSTIIKRRVIRSVIHKRPAEKPGEEFLCRREIARWNLNVIDCVRQ